MRKNEPYTLVGRAGHPDQTVVHVGQTAVGASALVLIAGPCAVESEAQLFAVAEAAAASGAHMLRGGAYKPRTSPYAFQGLGLEGLRLMREAGRQFGLPVVTEVVDEAAVNLACEYVDVLQVGARNMQNFSLLRAVGRAGCPVILKRGLCATLEEWLCAAEYILCEGNDQVILCERGIRSAASATQCMLDVGAVAALRGLTHLPVIVDPSHAAGHRDLVAPLSYAALAAGADGLLIEVHPSPDEALSDGRQSLALAEFRSLCRHVEILAPGVGRSFGNRE